MTTKGNGSGRILTLQQVLANRWVSHYLPHHFHPRMQPLELLDRLFAGGSASQLAWKQFLEDYSNLFLKVIWQFDKDRDKVMDAYLKVCTKFAEHDFAVLKKFSLEESEHPPKFTTWLGAIVRNMCIDIYRARHGRRRYPKALAHLNDFDRKVFDLYFWKGYAIAEIEAQFGKTQKSRIAHSIRRIQQRLIRPPQRFELMGPSIVPLDENAVGIEEPPDETERRAQLLEDWMSHLKPSDRLVVRLRFWENMTAKEIAKKIRISSEMQVYGTLRKAIKVLRRQAEHALRNE